MPKPTIPKLTLVKGDERAREFLEGGATIVDFLTDPFRPCVVRGSGQVVALNRGSAGDFFSCLWERRLSAVSNAYVVEYMADESVVLQMPQAYVRLPTNPDKFLAQNSACELDYKGGVREIVSELIRKGFTLEDIKDNLTKWDELEAQRKANVDKRRSEILDFYGV